MPTKLVCIKCGLRWTGLGSPDTCKLCGAVSVAIAVDMSANEARCTDCIKSGIFEGVLKCHLLGHPAELILDCPEGEVTNLPVVNNIFTLPILSGSAS